MLCGTHRLALALGAIVSMTSAGSAACTDHTFDPCPERVSGYALEVDPRSGRTWLKEAKVAAADTSSSTLGRLSAAAKKVPPGSLAKAQAPPSPEPKPAAAATPSAPELEQARDEPQAQRQLKKAPRMAEWHTQVRRYRKPLK
jgi:hypothetical protein